jgi:hypothetical protein
MAPLENDILLDAPPVLETQLLYDLIDYFNRINLILYEQYQTALTTVLSTIQSSTQELRQATQVSDEQLQQFVPTSLEPLYDQMKQVLVQSDYQFVRFMVEQPVIAAVATCIVSFGLVSFLLSAANSNAQSPTQPYPLLTYDPIAARLYFDRRWPLAMARTAQILWISLNFGLSLWLDQIKCV